LLQSGDYSSVQSYHDYVCITEWFSKEPSPDETSPLKFFLEQYQQNFLPHCLILLTIQSLFAKETHWKTGKDKERNRKGIILFNIVTWM